MTNTPRPPAGRRPSSALRARSAPFLVAALAAAALAAEPSATLNTWGSQGGGVDDHRATSTQSGTSNNVHAQAIGCYAHASGGAVTGSIDADVALRAEAQSLTSYQLHAEHDAGSTCTWAVSGTMDWVAEAEVSTELDADASTSGLAMLVYSGDLALSGESSVAASSSGGSEEVTWEVSLTPSYKRKSTRATHANTDTSTGGVHAESSGTGCSVRVDVVSYAKGEIILDTNALGFGLATADLSTTNRGRLAMSITVTPPDAGGDPGAQTGPGADEGGPTTPGGGPSGGPTVTPRWKRFKVVVDGSTPPLSEEGGVRIEPELPEEPKEVSGPEVPSGSQD